MKKNPNDAKTSQSLPLLQAKLTAPFCTSSLVPRARLDTWLHSAESAKLVLVNAPAGFGKTTLLSRWFNLLQKQGEHVAWLTLDESDNDPAHFLTYLTTAIQKSIPDDHMPHNAGALAGTVVPMGVLLWLLDKLTSFQSPFFLFLDDFGALHNPEVLGVVQQFIHHLPPGKRIVMALRHLPDLGLSRIRARGELVEVDAEDLRFTLAETDLFIRQSHQQGLDEGDVRYLQETTEGWVAGLQLSTLSAAWRNGTGNLRQSGDSAFRNISEYLAEDVLAHQPEEMQAFLMQTSILNRLSGPLCDALTGRTDGYETLDYLERANLFLVPLDEERHWYRYHSLFSRFLRNRLERRGRDHLNILHRIASRWLEEEGEFRDAAQHAMASGDIEYAATLMEGCALGLAMAGHMVTVVEWGEQLPPETLRRHPGLLVAYCCSLIFRQMYEKTWEILDGIVDDESRSPHGLTLSYELLPACALLYISQDRITECEGAVTDGLAKFAGKRPTDRALIIGNILLMHIGGIIKMARGEFDEALACFGQAAPLTRRTADNLVARLYNTYLVASLELTQGRLHDALEMVRGALSDPSIGTALYSSGGVAAAMLQAEILYEMNQLDKAENLITQFRNLLPMSVPPDVMIIGLRTLARIRTARGDKSGAMHFLAELERLGAERGIPRATASAHQEEIRMALQQGDVDQALQVTRDHDDKALWQTYQGLCLVGNDPETPEISGLRLAIERGQPREALDRLKAALKTAQACRRVRQQITIQILLAKAHEACGERRPALWALRDALLAGQSGNFVRSFLDEGEPILGLLRELCKTVQGNDADSGKTISHDYLQQFAHAIGAPGSQPADPLQSADDAAPIEQLTDREISILEKLSKGLSNEAIADELFISKHTVRFHLRNIHSKLGASNRTQAVALARHSGMIR